MAFHRVAVVVGFLAAFVPCACSEDEAPAGGQAGKADAGPGEGGAGDAGSDDAAAPPPGSCPVVFRYAPPPGSAPPSVAVAGEWNGFSKTATPMNGSGPDGAFQTTVALPPGLHAYKLVLGGAEWTIDPGQGLRKWFGGVENSAVRVADCALPRLELAQRTIDRPAAGKGRFTARVRFVPGAHGAPIDPASVSVTVDHHGASSPAAASLGGDGGGVAIDLDLGPLEDGKFTARVAAADAGGRKALPLRLPFWIEPEAFDWRDAVVYMAVTDRLRNGDPSNDPVPTPGVQDPRADWRGGDLEGVRQVLAAGALDQLGVRALWLTPFATNPKTAYTADDGTHQVAGYHGYWPIRAREVDARLGGEAALRAMVAEAHRHGIRVLMDYVVNHVHEGHEYFAQHPDWFRTGCVCGTAGCDWTGHRLDCLFAKYLPDVNYTVPDAVDQFVADAVWWLDTFDLDGLRVDAVKHVEDVAVTNLATTIREGFEAAGTRYFLLGETAMGWSDCGIDCNKGDYETIGRYVGRFGLDGQFDFVLYHAVPYRTFAYDEKGMMHADYWARASQAMYPKGAVMTPYVGSHDTPRFVTLATYRGQDAAHDKGVPSAKWGKVADPPDGPEPYARHGLALAWLLGLPGAPLLYYGDEYGEFGGADPGNRAMWRGDSPGLSKDEAALLGRVRAMGKARRDLRALRRGGYRTLVATETVLVFAREIDGAKDGPAIVALSRDPAATTVTVSVPPTLAIADGTVLHDRLGGPDVAVAKGAFAVPLAAWGAAVLAP